MKARAGLMDLGLKDSLSRYRNQTGKKTV